MLEIFGPLVRFSWFNDDEFNMVVICFVAMEKGSTNSALQLKGVIVIVDVPNTIPMTKHHTVHDA
eukprot:scaffold7330_cov146-Cylindrotheca_fusiformis.AAC.18